MSKFRDGEDFAKAIYHSMTDAFDVNRWSFREWRQHIDMAINMLYEQGMADEIDVHNLVAWVHEDSSIWDTLYEEPLELIAQYIQAEHIEGDWAKE